MEINCVHCRQPWTLEPKKWRARRFIRKNGKLYRILKCPYCNALNLLKMERFYRITRMENAKKRANRQQH